MSSDKERIHRWLTQADLELMLKNEYRRGLNEAAWLLAEIKHVLLDASIAAAAIDLKASDSATQLMARIDRFLEDK